MYKRLRDDLGLVYSAGFYQIYKWKAGMLVGYIGCKADKTSKAIEETVKIMTNLQRDVPEGKLELKRLDTLNSFVFNVDTPFQLTEVYSLYHLRKEPLNTLEKIQDAYITASKQELETLARKFLKPEKVQIFIVADKTIQVKKDGQLISLEEDLMALADRLGVPFQETTLR
jgi:zinc protease